MVYSSVSNVTWTADANLLGTMMTTQGYTSVVNAIIAASSTINDTPNGYDTPANSGHHSVSASDFSSSNLGYTSWFGAMAFTKFLNSINYSGSDQWRLPSAGNNPQANFGQTGGELGQLYYIELHKAPYPAPNFGILGSSTFSDTSGSVGPFTNAHTWPYWSGTEYVPNPSTAWTFNNYSGGQDPVNKVTQYYAWAVSPGQMPAVPVPSAIWLMGSGLLGVLSLKRRGYAE